MSLENLGQTAECLAAALASVQRLEAFVDRLEARVAALEARMADKEAWWCFANTCVGPCDTLNRGDDHRCVECGETKPQNPKRHG
jgi:hypothetical protein